MPARSASKQEDDPVKATPRSGKKKVGQIDVSADTPEQAQSQTTKGPKGSLDSPIELGTPTRKGRASRASQKPNAQIPESDTESSPTEPSLTGDPDDDDYLPESPSKPAPESKKRGRNPKGQVQDQPSVKKICLTKDQKEKPDDGGKHEPATKKVFALYIRDVAGLESPPNANEVKAIRGFMSLLAENKALYEAEIASLKASLYTEVQRKEAARNARGEEKSQNAQLGEKLEKSSKYIAALKEKIEEIAQQNVHLQVQVESCSKENDELRKTNEKLNQDNKVLNGDNTAIHQDNKKFKAANQDLTIDKDSLSKACADLNSECEQLRDENKTLQANNQNLEKDVKRLQEDSQHWRNRTAELLSQAAKAIATNKVSDDTIAGKWSTLGFNIHNFVRHLSPFFNQQGDGAQEIAGCPVLGHGLLPVHLQQDIWIKVVQKIFSKGSLTWSQPVGSHFARFCHLLNEDEGDNPEFLTEAAPLKSQLAQVIAQQYGQNKEHPDDLLDWLLEGLDVVVDKDHKELKSFGRRVFATAVELHVMMMKSRAVFKTTFELENRPVNLPSPETSSSPTITPDTKDVAMGGCDSMDTSGVTQQTPASPPPSSDTPVETGPAVASGAMVPDVETEVPTPSTPTTRGSDGSFSRSYLPDCMEIYSKLHNKPDTEYEVQLVVSPMLEKIGNADGENYDVRMVLCKAQVVVG